MNGASFLIFLITALFLAATGTYLYVETVRDVQEGMPTQDAQAEVRVVNIIGQNVTNGTFRHVRIAVTSDNPISLNDTLITLRTEAGVADLRYRNGTLERNETDGFYTK